MADERARVAVKIVDPLTDANEASVDATGNLLVKLAANTGVDIGDVDVLSLPTSPDTIADDAAFGAGSAVFPAGLVFDDTTPDPVDEGDVGYQRMSVRREAYTQIRDAAGNERGANVDALNNLQVILGANTGVDIGDVDVTSMPLGASATEVQGTAADGAAAVGDPVQVGGKDGSGNMQSVLTDTDGHLQVDVLTGGGADSPTSPNVDTVTSAAVAAGASASLDGTQVGSGLTGKLAGITASASVPIKVEVRTGLNGAYTTRAVLFGKANEPIRWTPPHRNYIQQAENATAGFDGFNLNITNMDTTQAADVYGTLLWDEV